MRVPELHVGAVGGVTDVERIKHQHPGQITFLQLAADPVKPPLPHPGEVRRGQPGGGPFIKGQPGRADLNAVIIPGAAIRQG